MYLRCSEKATRTQQKQFEKTIEKFKTYVGTAYDRSGDLLGLFENLVTPVITKPENVDLSSTTTTDLQREIFKQDVAEYIKARNKLHTNLVALYEVIWGQCSKSMKTKLQGLSEYETIKSSKDCAALLLHIKAICHKFDSAISLYDAVDDAMVFLSS